jgi:hypothetical protein
MFEVSPAHKGLSPQDLQRSNPEANCKTKEHVGIASDLFGLAASSAVLTQKEFALMPAGLLQRRLFSS